GSAQSDGDRSDAFDDHVDFCGLHSCDYGPRVTQFYPNWSARGKRYSGDLRWNHAGAGVECGNLPRLNPAFNRHGEISNRTTRFERIEANVLADFVLWDACCEQPPDPREDHDRGEQRGDF